MNFFGFQASVQCVGSKFSIQKTTSNLQHNSEIFLEAKWCYLLRNIIGKLLAGHLNRNRKKRAAAISCYLKEHLSCSKKYVYLLFCGRFKDRINASFDLDVENASQRKSRANYLYIYIKLFILIEYASYQARPTIAVNSMQVDEQFVNSHL